jgi:outer membrane receptor protein involved in Fe transport
MLRVITTAFVVVSLLAASGVAMAQTTGNLRGLVKDATGAILPGATVTISSPALIGGAKTAITNGQGVYRFPSIAVGTYSVEFSMAGFQTFITEDVPVGLNATMSIDATLRLADIAESVTVTGESPTNRNFWDYAQMSPGIGSYSPDGQGSSAYAFGSGGAANAWNVDGIPLTSNDTGNSWYWVNPDMIEEVEVSGIGSPAEYGNSLGATINIVTKAGGNELHGGANFFFQADALTAENVVVNDLPFHREKYVDVTAQVGGPISEDRVWFMGAIQYQRDHSTPPGNDPDFFSEFNNDRFDFKLTARLSDKHKLDGTLHYEIWECCWFTSPFVGQDATASESGVTPSWKVGLTSVFSDTTLLELKYAGWWGDDIYKSVTGSQEEAFIDYSPPGGGPTTYSGGLWFPWDYFQWTHQANAKVTKYAEDFLNSQHDFKFGVQWGYGTARTDLKLSETGSYVYNYIYEYDYYGTIYEYQYLYRGVQTPYTYGGTSTNLGLFVDDSVTIGERLTLNLGLRYDHHNGDLADSLALDLNFEPIGVQSPGADGLINWNNWSPRFGFAYTPVREGGALIKGTAGIYYANNVMGVGRPSREPPTL